MVDDLESELFLGITLDTEALLESFLNEGNINSHSVLDELLEN